MDPVQLCLNTLDNLKGREPGWLPIELEDILMLMPRSAKENKDFILCVFMFNWIKTARHFKTSDWLPKEDDIRGLVKLYASLQSTADDE